MIVIIAVIATITIVSFSGIQLRANATALTDDLQKTEKTLRRYALEKEWSTWPLDTEAVSGVTSNPRIFSDLFKKRLLKITCRAVFS